MIWLLLMVCWMGVCWLCSGCGWLIVLILWLELDCGFFLVWLWIVWIVLG